MKYMKLLSLSKVLSTQQAVDLFFKTWWPLLPPRSFMEVFTSERRVFIPCFCWKKTHTTEAWLVEPIQSSWNLGWIHTNNQQTIRMIVITVVWSQECGGDMTWLIISTHSHIAHVQKTKRKVSTESSNSRVLVGDGEASAHRSGEWCRKETARESRCPGKIKGYVFR